MIVTCIGKDDKLTGASFNIDGANIKMNAWNNNPGGEGDRVEEIEFDLEDILLLSKIFATIASRELLK